MEPLKTKLANTVLMKRKNSCDIRCEGIGYYMQSIILVLLKTAEEKMRRKDILKD